MKTALLSQIRDLLTGTGDTPALAYMNEKFYIIRDDNMTEITQLQAANVLQAYPQTKILWFYLEGECALIPDIFKKASLPVIVDSWPTARTLIKLRLA